jgi:hypothetical protein
MFALQKECAVDQNITQRLGLMTARRLEHAASCAEERKREIEAAQAQSGVSRSGFGLIAVVRSHVGAFKEAGTGTLVDHLSIAADLHADNRLLDELEAAYLESVKHTASGLRRALPTILGRGRETLQPQCEQEIASMVAGLQRDATIAFARERLRIGQGGAEPTTSTTTASSRETRDLFLSHAGEDRTEIVMPLATELQRRGHSVWLAESELTIGDSLRANIDRGLLVSEFGVVVLSRAFFSKPWPRLELDALAGKAVREDRTVILPVRHHLTIEELSSYSPLLASVLSIDSGAGIPAVADTIVCALKLSRTSSPRD